MDERLAKALEFSNYRATIENQKRNLRSRVDTVQTITYNNGTFKADKSTISFIKSLVDLKQSNVIAVDERNNPIEISDPNEFLITLIEAYNSSMNEFLAESKKLAKARNIKKIMDW